MNTSNFVSIPAQMFPEQEILVFEKRRWTYGELWEGIQHLGNGFRSIGVGPGDRIAALQTNSDLYVAAYFAAAAIGAVFVPLNYRAKLPELEYMLNTAHTKVLLLGDRYVPAVTALQPRLPSVQTFVAMEGEQAGMRHIDELMADAGGEFQETEVDDDATTILMYTSGTTALPKGVVLTYNDFTAYVCANVELADGTPRGAHKRPAPRR